MIYFIILSLAVVVASGAQIVIKSRLTAHGEMPAVPTETLFYVFRLLFDPMILVAGAMLVCAALTWYFVVSRVPIGVAFAFAALSYPVVLSGAYLFLKEPVNLVQVAGNILIVAGILLVAFSGRVT